MKKTSITCTVILIVLLTVGVTTESIASTNGNNKIQSTATEKSYTKMKFIRNISDGETLLGISPDGKYLAEYGAPCVSILDSHTGKPLKIIDLSNQKDFVNIYRKHASWYGNSGVFTLIDSTCVPNELIIMKSYNFYIFNSNLNAQSIQQVTKEKVDKSYLKEEVLAFAPTWSKDGKNLIYSIYNLNSSAICKTNVSTGKRTELLKSPKVGKFTEAIELKDGLLLCEHNGLERGDNSIYMYDVINDKKTELNEIVGNENYTSTYSIQGWSEDRRTILINQYIAPDNIVAKSLVLSFDSKYKKYYVKTIFCWEVTTKKDVQLVYNSVLSAGGRYVIEVAHEGSLVLGGPQKVKKSFLKLYDIKEDKTFVVYEEKGDQKFGISSPQNMNSASIFTTLNGQVLVLFPDGYHLFQLE